MIYVKTKVWQRPNAVLEKQPTIKNERLALGKTKEARLRQIEARAKISKTLAFTRWKSKGAII